MASALGPALPGTVPAGGPAAAAGMPLGALARSLWTVLLGYTATGPGLANLSPVAVERAGPLASPGGVATASTLGYGSMPLGPPAIGSMTDRFSLPAALTGVAVLAAVATVIGSATRHVHAGRLRAVLRPSGWWWNGPDQTRGAGVPG